MNDDAARYQVAMQRVKKLRKALKTAECEWDLSRHTIKIQDGIINELSEENERLRKLLFKIENHYELSADGDDDTQEAFEFRELVCRFKNEVEYGT